MRCNDRCTRHDVDVAASRQIDPHIRKAAIAAIRRGELSVGEVAALLQIGKSSVSRWCGFDVELARRSYVARTWRRLTEKDRTPSKAELRVIADEAVKSYRAGSRSV